MKKTLGVFPWATRLASCMLLALSLYGCGSTPQPPAGQADVTTFTVSLANIHVVDAYGKRFMIDSGKHGDEQELIAAMRAAGINPRSIDYLIITHGHTDHAGGARYFKEHFDIPIIAGRGDQDMLAAGKNSTLCSTGLLASFLKPSIERESYPPVAADIWIDEHYDLAALGASGRIVSVPSHTPGSIALIIDDKGWVGDLVRGGLISKSKPVRHFYMCDLPSNDHDIKALLIDEAVKTWYTGHMGPVPAQAVREQFE